MTTIQKVLMAQSDFSLGESLLSVKDIVGHAKECGITSVVLHDTMSVSGMIALTTEAEKAGIKPVIGCILRVVEDPTDKSKQAEFHPKVYVRDEEGMQILQRLLTIANSDEQFYYYPRISVDQFLGALEGGHLAASTGDAVSVLSAKQYADICCKMVTRCSASQTFIELTPIHTPLYDKLNKLALEAIATTEALPLVTFPRLYYRRSDAASLDVMQAIVGNRKMSSEARNIHYSDDFYLTDESDLFVAAANAIKRIEKRYSLQSSHEWIEGIKNRQHLVGLIDYRWKKMDVSLPAMAADETAELVRLIREGFKSRLTAPFMGYQPTDLKPYIERVEYELNTLKSMGFVRYFLLVQDLVRWAKDNGIMVGPGRGSVGGSMIAYLIGITDVDPLRFNLFFERFINPERLDLPDADLDFMSERRHEVIEYLRGKYGSECVAGISNYTTLGAASALRDVGRVFDLTFADLNATKSIDTDTLTEALADPSVLAFANKYPEIWDHAMTLEGRMRSLGRHAAGVVVAGEPLCNRAVVERRSGEDAVNWDKRFVEHQGLVKMDILGLSTLDMLSLARDMLERDGIKLDYTQLPLDDEEVMDGFGNGDTVGVFQFESGGMRSLLKSLAQGGQLTFDDVTATTALYRPGPMQSGLMDEYVSIRQGLALPHYEHANMRPALEWTGGVLIYQEQVMQLARDLAGFTLADADHLRKAMGKKDPAAMAKQRAKFVNGCVSHSGMGEDQAGVLFDKIDKFAGYAFNLSHSVEYTIISYWSMYLKTHYPEYFYAAQLSITKEDKLTSLVTDAAKHGVVVLPPDINRSMARYFVIDKRSEGTYLFSPFNRVKGVSDRTADIIEEVARKHGPFDKADSFHQALAAESLAGKVNKTVRERLSQIGAYAHTDMVTPATDSSRLKDQKANLPGLITEMVRATRKLKVSKHSNDVLGQMCKDMKVCEKCDLKGSEHPYPRLGANARVMVITDCPNRGEAHAGKLMEGRGADYVKIALKAAGIPLSECYFTTLVKAPKSDTSLTADQINACKMYLDAELGMFKPPVIVALGANAIRHLMPGIKGSMDDLAGQVHFDKDRDASIVLGLTPGAIYIDPKRQERLNEVFQRVFEALN